MMTDRIEPAFPSPCRSGFQAQELAAILLRLPESGNPWIDEMIRKANEQNAHPLVRIDPPAPSVAPFIQITGKIRDHLLQTECICHQSGAITYRARCPKLHATWVYEEYKPPGYSLSSEGIDDFLNLAYFSLETAVKFAPQPA